VAEAVAEDAEYLARLDPASFGEALARVGAGVATNPAQGFGALARFGARMLAATADATRVALGQRPEPDLAPSPRDRRFADPAWERNPWFFAQRQAYLAWSHLVHDLVDAARLDPLTAQKAAFAAGFVVDAAAPTNFLLTNPAALRRAFETGGVSVLRGLRNFFQDQLTNNGRPRQVDTTPFELGRNLAATPGKVVYRNDLMELIQYDPQTETVFEVPLLLSPPWINKYYVMDLAPGRSFVEWAVRQGHTVFAISYRNPDDSMRDIDLEDYLLRGPRQALSVVADITGAPAANVVGLCIGGTLTGMLLAHLAALGERRVHSATLLNTLIDFSDPGLLGAFTDAESVGRLEQRVAADGFLHEDDLSATFNLLRDNDLIWNYVASNWLMGESPPAFDILAWNCDGMNLPVRMMSSYLRSCYVENRLAQGTMELANTPLRLDRVDVPVYIVAAKEDHIVPWTSSYDTTRLLRGPIRFILTSSGHIAGIVNPPSTKRKYWAADDDQHPEDPATWRSRAREHPGSWWEDWTVWIAERAGGRRPPPPTGSSAHPALDDAPGTYVHG
jgi:polyhydroxyalkanoate synthase